MSTGTGNRSTESNAAFRSTNPKWLLKLFLLWMIVFKVKIRSIIDRPGVNPTHFAPLYGEPEAGHEPYSAEP